MRQGPRVLPWRPAALDRAVSGTLSQQLHDRLHQAIVTSQLRPGDRVPSTRNLASQLGVSRNTVSLAYLQLLAEGLIFSTRGRGTWVADRPHDVLPPVADRSQSRPSSRATLPEVRGGATTDWISRRAAAIASLPPFRAIASDASSHERPVAFRAGVPALDAFPHRIWAHVVARRARCAWRELLEYQDDAGYLPLRVAIAAHLGVTRGVFCRPDQVIVVSGAQAALDLAARVLLDPGDSAWIEEPGSVGARAALLGAGVHPVPVPLDSQGLDPAAGMERAPNPRLIYVTPFHQVPTGITMSLARRLELARLAQQTGAWILEDGHGSEHQLDGRPLPALQGLDDAGRVLYIGTFGKVLFPALLVGYVVAPPPLVGALVAANRVACAQVPALIQAALADFIVEGHLTRHLGRMLQLYRRRRAALVEGLHRAFSDQLALHIPQCGVQLVAWLPRGIDDRSVARAAVAHRVEVAPVSGFYLEHPLSHGLVLGYAAVDEEATHQGVARLSAALAPLLP